MSSKMFNIDASDQSSSIFQPSHKNEMLAFHISASTMQVDIFKMAGHFPAVLEGYFWQNLGTFSSHANGNKTLYFWQHMRTFSSGVSGNKTRYFWRKVGMIFVSVCSNNVMRWDVWTFSSHVNDNKTAYFWQNTGTFSGHARGNNTGNVWWGAWQLPAVFLATEPGMPKHDLSPKPNKWVFVPKLCQTLSTALWKHRIENLTLNHKCSGNWVSMFFFLFTAPLCWLVVFIFS